jgi:hypothetical protein
MDKNIYGPGDDNYGRDPKPWLKNDMKVTELSNHGNRVIDLRNLKDDKAFEAADPSLKQAFDDELEAMRQGAFHMTNGEAMKYIDEYLKQTSWLLDIHPVDWYYKNV